VFYQRKQRSGSARAVQRRLEGEMQHYLRLGGIAAIALAAAALSACYPPPPETIAAAPAPWTPPPA